MRQGEKEDSHTYWSLFEANGCSPHECDTTEVNETAIRQNVCLLRNLRDLGGEGEGRE